MPVRFVKKHYLQDTNPFDTSAGDKFGFSVSTDGIYTVVGAYAEKTSGGGLNSGSVSLWNNVTGSYVYGWINPGYFNALYGYSVAVKGNYIAVGAPLDNTSPTYNYNGQVYVYDATTRALLYSVENTGYNSIDPYLDYFGSSVALSEKYLVVAAENYDQGGLSAGGIVYVFDITDGTLISTLVNPNPYGTTQDDSFGISIGVSGGYVVVGAYNEDEASAAGSGKAYVFNAETGALVYTLANPGDYSTNVNDNFGYRVAITGNYIAVSAPSEDPGGQGASGIVYIFDVITGLLVSRIKNPNAYSTGSGDQFGISLAMYDNYLIAGANNEDSLANTNAGKAYVFYIPTGDLLSVLDDPNAYSTAAGDQFGSSVAITKNFAVVGAINEDDVNGTDAGAVYIYEAIDRGTGYKVGSQGGADIADLLVPRSVFTEGTLYGCGYAANGYLGINPHVTANQEVASLRVSVPTQVFPVRSTNWKQIEWSGTGLGLKNDGTLWAWGNNVVGQCGLNLVTNTVSSPTQVGSDNTWKCVASNDFQSFAVKTNGTLWAWGQNVAFVASGNLGLNDAIDRSSPVQIGTGSDWKIVKPGSSSYYAIKNNGTLWAWGYNYYGQLGDNTIINRSSPVQVGTGTDWKDVESSYYMTVATKLDGTIWTWGWNTYGQLGDNTIINRSSPVQLLSNDQPWVSVTSIGFSTFGIQRDGTLWGWGNDPKGGYTGFSNLSSPVQLFYGYNWKKVFRSGSTSYFALKTDNTLWAWGVNSQAQLGVGQTTVLAYSSPVQVTYPVAKWKYAQSASNTTFFLADSEVPSTSTSGIYLTEPGKHKVAVPAGVTSYNIIASAGGGGGGSSETGDTSCSGDGGGGGGGGAFAIGQIAVTPGEVLDIQVGRGGVGYTSFNAPGENGVATSILGTNLYLLLGGGQGGAQGGNNNAWPSRGYGGPGGEFKSYLSYDAPRFNGKGFSGFAIDGAMGGASNAINGGTCSTGIAGTGTYVLNPWAGYVARSNPWYTTATSFIYSSLSIGATNTPGGLGGLAGGFSGGGGGGGASLGMGGMGGIGSGNVGGRSEGFPGEWGGGGGGASDECMTGNARGQGGDGLVILEPATAVDTSFKIVRPGTYHYVVATGTNSLNMVMVGGGGGGGASGYYTGEGAGGGGAGGQVMTATIAVVGGDRIKIEIRPGGTGGVASTVSAGGTGGATSVYKNGSLIYTAAGGGGGSPASGATGGNGGSTLDPTGGSRTGGTGSGIGIPGGGAGSNQNSTNITGGAGWAIPGGLTPSNFITWDGFLGYGGGGGGGSSWSPGYDYFGGSTVAGQGGSYSGSGTAGKNGLGGGGGGAGQRAVSGQNLPGGAGGCGGVYFTLSSTVSSGPVLNIASINTLVSALFEDVGTVTPSGTDAEVQVEFSNNGTFTIYSANNGILVNAANWLTSGNASDVWIRGVLELSNSFGLDGYISPTTGWVQMTAPYVFANVIKEHTYGGMREGDYHLEFSFNGGSTVTYTTGVFTIEAITAL